MNAIVVTLIILFILFLFVVLYIMRHRTPIADIKKNDLNTSSKLAVCQINSSFDTDHCDKVSKPFKDIIDANEVAYTNKFDQANLILFTDYSLIDQNYGKLPFQNDKLYYVYGISGSDQMANKAALGTYMKDKGYENFIPKTYVLYKSDDMSLFARECKNKKIYILKKNIQRQEGNLITEDITYIKTKALRDGYVVCQELLQNPYLVNRRKINIRIYLLVLSTKDKCSFYIYNNGFMYYTPDFFKPNTTDSKYNITTGYIDRKVYEENPLTLQDFYDYLGDEKAFKLAENINLTFRALKDCYIDVLYKSNSRQNILNFNIFGVDIAPDNNLETQIIEINKGPDLSYKDERDKGVKLTMIRDLLNLVDLSSDGNKDNFIKV
jgi:hypothetical protein